MPRRDEFGWNVALVGASSLKGKEVKSIFEERHFPLRRLALLDTPDVGGQLTEFEDEPAIILPIGRESFEDMQLAIFASSPAFTRDHWQMAQSSNCAIIDLSCHVESHPEVRIGAPLIEHLPARLAPQAGEKDPGGWSAPAQLFVPAHPVSIAIAAILLRLSRLSAVERSVITVFEPVSEHDQAGVDELHQQTVKLLAFQKIPRNVFDVQVAFNLLTSYGEQSRPTLRDVELRIASHLSALLGGRARRPALRLFHAPVFFGHTFSCYVELKDAHPTEAVEKALEGSPLAVCRDPQAQPNIVDGAGSDDVLLGRVEKDLACETGYWVWGVLDNVRFAALNTVQIAERLLSARLPEPSENPSEASR
jgi:aspartate-semialdehyde dehydrogenase